jgi:hypothetical protein
MRDSEGPAEDVRELLAALERRIDILEARLEAVDDSFVRHQQQNEDDFRRAEQTVDRVGGELNHHLDAHWRSGR